MARNKTKDSDAVSFRIRKDISERLNDYSELSHIPKNCDCGDGFGRIS